MILEVEKDGVLFHLCKECPPSAGKYVSRYPLFHPMGFGHVMFTDLQQQLKEGAKPILIKSGVGLFRIKYRIKSDTKPDKI